MSLRGQKSQLKMQFRPVQPCYNGNIIGDARPHTRISTAVNLEEHTSGERTGALASAASSITTLAPAEATSSTSTSAIPPGSVTTSDAPPVTEQIANLLNLAQHLLSSVRAEQQRHHRRHHRHRRESRLQESTPYQRPTSEALQAVQPHHDSDNSSFQINGTNVNTVSIGGTCAITNGDANSIAQQQSEHTQFRNASSSSSSNNNSNSRVSEDNINFKCSICLDSYLLHRPMVTQCGHIFCKRCIRQSVSCQGKCPMCNRKLNSNSMFRVYF
ncbi:serine-rich adhesin for platelets [Zeugodacus cucurbitae]|nr:serine-rich adhesin for platelets [Zeugodacus cucurbitae]